ncbi:MAG: hypothetical protein U0935_08385 [Pirellulales bacterium]
MDRRLTFVPAFRGMLAGALLGLAAGLATSLVAHQAAAVPPLPLSDGFALELLAGPTQLGQAQRFAWDVHGTLLVVRRDDPTTIHRLQTAPGSDEITSAAVWANPLPPCRALCAARGGVVVWADSHLLYLADDDADGRAEVRETLVSGPLLALPANATPALVEHDGWLYLSGTPGGTIQGPRLTAPQELPAGDVRLLVDGSRIEWLPGPTAEQGQIWGECGERCVLVPHQGIVQVDPGPPNGRSGPSAARDGESSPTGAKLPAVSLAGSPLWYTDPVLPGLQGQVLVCEPQRRRVRRWTTRRSGWRYHFAPVTADDARELVELDDPAFQPVALGCGPDGLVWLLDAGSRLWRLTHRDVRRDAVVRQPAPDAASSADSLRAAWIADVSSPFAWRRTAARRGLAEKHDRAAVDPLARLIRHAPQAASVVTALTTLDQLDSLNSVWLLEALTDADPVVRCRAVELTTPVLDKRPGVLDAVLDTTRDADVRVQLRVIRALAHSRSARVIGAWARLARAHAADPVMEAVLQQAARGREEELRRQLLTEPDGLGQARHLVELLAQPVPERRE